jgi:ATP-dependent DNA helicase PIF1
LNGSTLANFQNKFKDITHIIIDEYSMVHQVMLAVIDKRLRQATGRDEWFGGISVILVGDPGQLPPVGGSPLYQSIFNNPKQKDFATHGYNCYLQFKTVILLETSERQKNPDNDPNQQRFIDLLLRLRNGVFNAETELDWKFLLQRQVLPRHEEEFKEAIRLFPDRASCSKFNNEKLKQLKMPIFKTSAKNTPFYARSHDDDKYRGLENMLNLAVNARITLNTNLWISQGLVNGANGIIRDVIFEINNPNPTALLIQFDNYTGPKLFDHDDPRKDWIPINIFECYSTETKCTRKQFPLKLAYALTIHKSQGATLKKAVIDLGSCERTLGLTFVALSRLCNYKDFIIQPFTLDRLKKIGKNNKK